MQEIFSAFGFSESTVTPFGSGLINDTWLLQCDEEKYILQRVNHMVFKNPFAIAKNIQSIGHYLQEQAPGYLFVQPLLTIHGDTMYFDENSGCWYRLFPFVKNSHTIDVATNPAQAAEAASQFGKFTFLLKDFDVPSLEITLPDFHNLSLRYEQFNLAVQNGNKQRITTATKEISFLEKQHDIVSTFKMILSSPAFKKRVTHHDTKISNVLL